MPKKETKNDRTKLANENITRLLAKGKALADDERKSPGGTDVMAALMAELPSVQHAIASNISSTDNLALARTKGAETRKVKAESRHKEWREYALGNWSDHRDWAVTDMASHVKEHFSADQSVSSIADALAGIKARALHGKR
jgi:hypothetical protein